MGVATTPPTASPEQQARLAFAEVLRAEQERAGLNTDQLAARSGISARAIGRYRSARRAPRLPNLVRLAAGLGCEPAALIPNLQKCDEPGSTPARASDPPVQAESRGSA